MLLNAVYNIGTIPSPPGGGVTDFEVTVPSGKVSSNLTAFPLMVDFVDMPSSFWTGVRSDGGNIRAYQSDGSTMLPHDVTFIDTTQEEGRMFIRTDLLTGSDNVIIVRLLDTSETELAPGDTNGQYDVWQDFDGVVVFPDTQNRVDGGALTAVGANGGAFDWKEVARQDYVAHQGVAYDGTYHYAVDTNYLRKYSTGTTVVASNSNPCGDVNTATGETTLNHCGSPTIIDGQLWIPVEVYTAGTYNKQYIAKFSLTDLSFISYIQLTGETRESSALIEDASASPARIYVTDYTNGATIPYFNKSTGAYIGALTLSETLSGIQGIADLGGGTWIVSCDDYTSGPIYVESDGTVGDYVFQEWYVGAIEGVSYHAASGTITYDRDTGGVRDYQIVPRTLDWQRKHGTVSYLTMTTSPIWTVAMSWRPTKNLSQSGLIGVNVTGDSSTTARTACTYRSTGKISIWNSVDGWFESAVTATVYNKYRVGAQYNGTTHRKVYADGAATLDSGCAQRPASGANMDWFFGASNSYNTETGYGEFQFAWIRKEVMTDAWMAADAANMNSPATFYSIAEAA